MQLSSPSIVSGRIARVHACRGHGGEDRPLELEVRDVPTEAAFLAVVADDPDALKPAGQVWVHWNLFNVPAQAHLAIGPGTAGAGDLGRTTGNARGYEGPCPPDGTHTYRFAVYAYRDRLPPDAWQSPLTIDAFESRFGSRMLARALVTGQFG